MDVPEITHNGIAFSIFLCYNKKGVIGMQASRQRERMLEWIRDYMDVHGYGPSVREICGGLGLRSPATVQYHLKALAEEGSIVMTPGKKRSISLPVPEHGGPASSTRLNPGASDPALLPIVGTVAAGQPILAEEQIEGYFPWEGGDGWFALRVKGESMKNAGILPGDLVIVRPQPTAEQGEIVVALLGNEATVKRFSRDSEGVWLLPENEAFEPIDGREAAILGVVRGVVRVFK